MKTRLTLRLTIVALLVLSYVCMALYFHLVLDTGVVYVHFGYLSVVLAAMWWGRRGLIIAVLVASLVVVWRMIGISEGPIWNDMARVCFVLLVAGTVAFLSERVTTGTQALRVSEAYYRAFFENALAGIMLYRDDHILLANRRFGEILGYETEEMVGMPVRQILDESRGALASDLAAKLQKGVVSTYHRECQLQSKQDTPIWVDLATSMADYEGKPAVQVNVYDITSRKEAEQKEIELRDFSRKQEDQLIHSLRLAELGEMAASVAHELNQPLTGIRNFAKNAIYMLENQVGDAEEIENTLHQISRQVDRASQIIRRMRQMTRKDEREYELVDINVIVKDSLDFLSPQLKLSGVEVTFEPSWEVPRILGHRIRLEQVLLNLLTNARQAMENSEVRQLAVTTGYQPKREHPIFIEIRDTGVGFEQAKAEQLFAPFYSTKKAGHGTGLGLSISHSIVNDHGGRIEAVGEPDRGAIFTIRLPASNEPG